MHYVHYRSVPLVFSLLVKEELDKCTV